MARNKPTTNLSDHFVALGSCEGRRPDGMFFFPQELRFGVRGEDVIQAMT